MFRFNVRPFDCFLTGILLAALGAGGVGHAQAVALDGVDRSEPDLYEDARGVALGGGNRAVATGANAVAYNPANLPLGGRYEVQAGAGYIPQQASAWVGGAVIDSTTSAISAGVSARYVFGNDARNYEGFDGKLALGMNLGKYFGIGLSGRYVKLDTKSRTMNDEPFGPRVEAFTMDGALRVTPFEGFHIAAYANNFIDTHSPLAPVELGGGAGYLIANRFQIGADFLVDLTSFPDPSVRFGFGGEYVIAEMVPVRVGYRRDIQRDLHEVTAGLGYRQDTFGIDLGLRQKFDRVQDTTLVLTIRVFVNP